MQNGWLSLWGLHNQPRLASPTHLSGACTFACPPPTAPQHIALPSEQRTANRPASESGGEPASRAPPRTSMDWPACTPLMLTMRIESLHHSVPAFSPGSQGR
jgi:hypothetical protein